MADAAGQTENPRLSAGLVAGVSLGLTAGLMALRLAWVERVFPQIVPKGWAALPFAGLLGGGLAVLIGLAWANRGRWRAVLRPNRGRVIGALVLGFLTPLAVIDWVPWIVGGFSVVMLVSSLGSSGFADIEFSLLVLPFVVAWYPVACLIVSGIHGRKMRVAVFALMFWAAYAALLLAIGTPKFID